MEYLSGKKLANPSKIQEAQSYDMGDHKVTTVPFNEVNSGSNQLILPLCPILLLPSLPSPSQSK